MAGGKNTRMGMKKSFLKVGNARLIDKILGIYHEIFSEVVIVTNDPLSYTEFTNTILVTDIYRDKGALGGIYTGLFFASCNYSFIAACDMPFLNKDFICYLIDQIDKYDIIVPKLSDGFQPLHAIYSKNCLPVIKRHLLADKIKVISFYKEMRLLSISEEKIRPFNKDGYLFLNINTPKDLESISLKAAP